MRMVWYVFWVGWWGVFKRVIWACFEVGGVVCWRGRSGVFWIGSCGSVLKSVVWYFEECIRGVLKRVVWYFEDVGVTLKRVLIWEAWYFQEGYLVLSKGLFGNLKRVHCLVFWWVWFGMCLFERSHPLRNVHSIKCLTCCLMSCFDIDFISIFEIVCKVSTFLVYLCLYS